METVVNLVFNQKCQLLFTKPSFSCSSSCNSLTKSLLLVLEFRRARQWNRFTPREMIKATETMIDITKAAM